MASKSKIGLSDLTHEDKIRLFNPEYMIFDPVLFLRDTYEVTNFEECIEWIIKNNIEPVNTRARVIDFGLRGFKDQIDIVDSRFVDFFIIYFKRSSFLVLLYRTINKFLDIKDGKVVMVESSSLAHNEHVSDRVRYIEDSILTRDLVHKYLLRYLKKAKEAGDIGLKDMCENLVPYILEKFKMISWDRK